jgi:hypothetical protein
MRRSIERILAIARILDPKNATAYFNRSVEDASGQLGWQQFSF